MQNASFQSARSPSSVIPSCPLIICAILMSLIQPRLPSHFSLSPSYSVMRAPLGFEPRESATPSSSLTRFVPRLLVNTPSFFRSEITGLVHPSPTHLRFVMAASFLLIKACNFSKSWRSLSSSSSVCSGCSKVSFASLSADWAITPAGASA